MVNYEILCREVTQLTSRVGQFILNERKIFDVSAIEKKGPNDLVSYVDRKAEEMLAEKLKALFPEAGFIAEENTFSGESREYNWIIDPLDGTTNYIHGMPCFCISIGLARENEVILGVVHELNFNECFYGWKDGGAYLNGEKISVSGTPVLNEALLATGFPYHDYSRMKPYMEVFDFCMRNTHGLRRLGSAAADLAYVACGRFDGFYEYGLNSWDVAGGVLIVQEAGGRVTDFSGNTNYLFGSEVIATNKLIAEEFLNVVKEIFQKEG